ncbi:MAG: hypothetical protein K6F82_06575 [Sphaerochaetaceae bacterium]|nr:hypothetical protein [Sphaerochaetaceae bacterium]
MSDKDVKSDIKLDAEKKGQAKKEPWTTKRVITTIIIVALALLMVGSSYYIIIMIQQGNDDSNVFGYYDGEPIKYEAGSVFATNVGQSDYATAIANGDFNSLWSIWYSAYQNEIVFQAMDKAGKEAGIITVPELVNRLIISSGVYSDEENNFSEEVYNNTAVSQRNAQYNYMEKVYAYQTVMSDLYTAKVSSKEVEAVTSLSSKGRNFEYVAIDYNVYPDSLAQEYDTSAMEKTTDESGNTVEPTLSEIKAYIFQNNPELVTPYIDEAVASVSASDFDSAADQYGVISVLGASNNIGKSSFIMGFEYADEKGYLTSAAADEALSRTLFTEAEGYVTDPVSVDGAYIVVRVGADTVDDSLSYYVSSLYNAYAGQNTIVDYASAVLASDKLDDHFTEKFLEIFLSSSVN